MPGMVALQDRLGAGLVRGVAIAVQEQDRDGLDAELLRSACPRATISSSSSGDAIEPSARMRSFDLEAQRALDQRPVLLEEKIVRIRPVDASDLVDVAKALCRDERRLGAGALEQRVDGDGRAVQEEAGLLIVRAGLGDAGIDALDEMRGRRQALAQQQPAGFLIERRDIGERAADIGPEPRDFRPGAVDLP